MPPPIRLPAALPLLLGLLLLTAPRPAAATDVRLQTTHGDIDIQLFDANTPGHVANFLGYLNDRDYDRSLVHRSQAGFVIQGGGFWLDFGNLILSIPTDPTVPTEAGISNVRGTIALALPGFPADPNAGTNQWFINVGNNVGLDAQGFTVFGMVTAGLGVVDAINALPIWDMSIPLFPFPFSQMPLDGFDGVSLFVSNLVLVNRAVIVAPGQCGDVNDDLVFDDVDPDHLRSHLADPVGTPLTAPGAANCPVNGVPGCTILKWVVMERDLRKELPRVSCP